MHVAARVKALYDFLAKRAALGEVESAILGGLLGEFAVANVCAVERCSLEHAQPLQALRLGEETVCVQERLYELRCVLTVGPQFVTSDEGAISVDRGNHRRVPCQRLPFERCKRCHRKANLSQ